MLHVQGRTGQTGHMHIHALLHRQNKRWQDQENRLPALVTVGHFRATRSLL